MTLCALGMVSTLFFAVVKPYIGPLSGFQFDRIYNLLPFFVSLIVGYSAYRFMDGNRCFCCHYRRYSLGRLKSALKESRYTIEYATYFFSALPFPILLWRTLPSRFGLRHSGWTNQYRNEHSINPDYSGDSS